MSANGIKSANSAVNSILAKHGTAIQGNQKKLIEKKREILLDRMLRNGKITAEQAAKMRAKHS